MGENSSPSGKDFSVLAKFWRNVASIRTPYMKGMGFRFAINEND